jgi:hypothetical protein
MTSGPVPQLLSVPFAAGVVVPALFWAEPAEPAELAELAVVLFRTLLPVALFRALVAVVLADPAADRLAAAVRGAVRVGVLFAAGRAGAVFGAVLTAAFGSVLVTAFGAALTAGVWGLLSVTASCHALRLGTSGELSR